MFAKPHPDVVFRAVTEGGILLDTKQEVYFGLNPVGSQVWQLLGTDGAYVDLVCLGIGEIYPEVDPETIRADVEELLSDLETHGLISFEASGASAATVGSG